MTHVMDRFCVEEIMSERKSFDEYSLYVGDGKMTARELAEIAVRTCQWTHIFQVQVKRFLEDFNRKGDGVFPWEGDDEMSLFAGDRIFMISAIQHVINGGSVHQPTSRTDHSYLFASASAHFFRRCWVFTVSSHQYFTFFPLR